MRKKENTRKYSQSSATITADEATWQQRIADSAYVVLEDFSDIETEFHA